MPTMTDSRRKKLNEQTSLPPALSCCKNTFIWLLVYIQLLFPLGVESYVLQSGRWNENNDSLPAYTLYLASGVQVSAHLLCYSKRKAPNSSPWRTRHSPTYKCRHIYCTGRPQLVDLARAAKQLQIERASKKRAAGHSYVQSRWRDCRLCLV
jgi:hypothetical protein